MTTDESKEQNKARQAKFRAKSKARIAKLIAAIEELIAEFKKR